METSILDFELFLCSVITMTLEKQRFGHAAAQRSFILNGSPKSPNTRDSELRISTQMRFEARHEHATSHPAQRLISNAQAAFDSEVWPIFLEFTSQQKGLVHYKTLEQLCETSW
jgi:hypothetical protein